jgi:hypothetical protein
MQNAPLDRVRNWLTPYKRDHDLLMNPPVNWCELILFNLLKDIGKVGAIMAHFVSKMLAWL